MRGRHVSELTHALARARRRRWSRGACASIRCVRRRLEARDVRRGLAVDPRAARRRRTPGCAATARRARIERAQARLRDAGRPAREPQPARACSRAATRCAGTSERTAIIRDADAVGARRSRPRDPARRRTRLRGAAATHGSDHQGLRIGERGARGHRQADGRGRPDAREIARALRARRAAVALLPRELEEAERRLEILNERGELRPAHAAMGLDPVRRGRQIAGDRLRSLDAWLAARREVVERALERFLPPARPRRRPSSTEAMRYSVFAGGKRLRPVLALAAAEAVGAHAGWTTTPPRPGAGAPGGLRARDDPHLFARPRRPAGDGQRHAAPRPADVARRLRRRHGDSRRRRAADRGVRAARARAGGGPAAAIGHGGAGAAQARTPSHHRRRGGRARHGRRPGARSSRGRAGRGASRRDRPARDARPQDRRAASRASALAGAVMAGASGEVLGAVGDYGTHIGLAFQIVDDILDVEEASAVLGKTSGKDAAAGKPTYPSLYGLDESRRRAAVVAAAGTDGAARRPASAGSCRRSPSGSSRAGIEEGIAARHAARRTGTGRHARAGAGADPRRPGARQRPAGDEGRHTRSSPKTR